MQTSYPSLIDFENDRSRLSYIPEDQSNSFYNIGVNIYDDEGNIVNKASYINIYTDDDSFNTTIQDGVLPIGQGTFEFSTDESKQVKYDLTTVRKDATMVVNDTVIIDGATINIEGTFILEENAKLILRNNGYLYFPRDSKFIINKNASIEINDTSMINVYGSMDIDVDLITTVINIQNMVLDPSVAITPLNMNLGDRIFSMTDYDASMRNKLRKGERLNTHTVGEYNVPNGRLGYEWKNGSLADYSQILELSVTYGNGVLGDFKLSVLGTQYELIPNLQVIQSVKVYEGATLYIAEEYEGYPYLMPELYVGDIPEDTEVQGYDPEKHQPGMITVDGTIIIDGEKSNITLDKSGQLNISEKGIVRVQNGGSIVNCESNNDDVVMTIDGTLILDSIQQIETFNTSNIEIGNNGKIIILNPSNNDHILFNVPDVDQSSELYTQIYRLFRDRLDHIEYHISPHTGIKIDKYYPYYNKDLTDWYGGMRIEKAVHDGLIVWESGAYIELDHDIINWATLDCTLLEASRLFKSFSSIDSARLIEVANRLKYAGFGDVRFRFTQGNEYNDVTLTLIPINLNSVTSMPNSTDYSVNVDNDGNMFIRNKVSSPDPENIISNSSKSYSLSEGDNSFSL